ncbi:MAG: VCBS repeat-containing protein [Pseudomonadota bacterium]
MITKFTDPMLPRNWLILLTAASLMTPCAQAFSQAQYVAPDFRIQTGMVSLQFPGSKGESLAFAGRDQNGTPKLGLLRLDDTKVDYREIELPDTAVAIDAGASSTSAEALFVLSAKGVLALDRFDGKLKAVASSSSLYRGRSLAELTSGLNFARDIDADGNAEFLIPDFDVLHVVSEDARRALALPSYRRGYDQTVTYRPTSVTAAPSVNGGALYAVRGKELLSFSGEAENPELSTLTLGLSDENERETFYNSYEDIDQNDVVLREMDRFVDVNGDSLPDIMTLETVSEGVFDKRTTYRVHHGRVMDDRLVFDQEADTTLSSEGYQVGARIAELDESRKLMVTASVRVGVRAIIGALFSRAVTMRVEIYPADQFGTIASNPGTEIKSRVKFDFGTGQVEFPTIVFGDIDGDGINDLILKERKRALNWRRGNEQGAFAKKSAELNVTGPADGTDVALSDLDGDARDEVIVLYGRADGEDLAGQIAVYRDFRTSP